jgi:hypothetical protein
MSRNGRNPGEVPRLSRGCRLAGEIRRRRLAGRFLESRRHQS